MPKAKFVIWQDAKSVLFIKYKKNPVLFTLVFLQTSLILSSHILGLPCRRPQSFWSKITCILIFYKHNSRETSQSVVVTFISFS